MKNFVLIGNGFIAQKHKEAINNLPDANLLAVSDLVEAYDRVEKEPFYFQWAHMLKELRSAIDYIVICTPSHTHMNIIKKCFELCPDASIICEKPIATNKSDYEELLSYEVAGKKIFTTIQLSHNLELAEEMKMALIKTKPNEIKIKFLVSRDENYMSSWKGNPEESGGILYNLGIHYFDLLLRHFGNPTWKEIEIYNKTKAKGSIKLENAWVDFEFSLEQPKDQQVREFIINNTIINLNSFNNSHNVCYTDIVSGTGITIKDQNELYKLMEYFRSELCT